MILSVIIPSYRPKDYFWECLNSIKNQTLAKEQFEVIIVLNGCRDPYYSQINDYVGKCFNEINFCLLYTEQAGVSNARNIGLDVAQGQYVVFIDDDDYVSPVYLQELIDNVVPNGVVLTDSISFNDETKLTDENYLIHKSFKKLKNKKAVTINSSRAYFSGPVMKIIPANVISNVRFNIDFKNGEDSLFMFEISKNIRTIKLTSSDAVYYRRVRVGSAVSNMKNKKYVIVNRLMLIKNYVKLYCKDPFKYDFLFLITRILASIKVVLISFR